MFIGCVTSCISNNLLYENLPKITNTISTQRMSFVGHCFCSKEVVHKILLWELRCGKNTRRRPTQNFINQLTDDTNLHKEDSETVLSARIA